MPSSAQNSSLDGTCFLKKSYAQLFDILGKLPQSSTISSPALMSRKVMLFNNSHFFSWLQMIWLLGSKEWFTHPEPSRRAITNSASGQYIACSIVQQYSSLDFPSTSLLAASQLRKRLGRLGAFSQGTPLTLLSQIHQMAPLGMSSSAKRPMPLRGLCLYEVLQMMGMIKLIEIHRKKNRQYAFQLPNNIMGDLCGLTVLSSGFKQHFDIMGCLNSEQIPLFFFDIRIRINKLKVRQPESIVNKSHFSTISYQN